MNNFIEKQSLINATVEWKQTTHKRAHYQINRMCLKCLRREQSGICKCSCVRQIEIRALFHCFLVQLLWSRNYAGIHYLEVIKAMNTFSTLIKIILQSYDRSIYSSFCTSGLDSSWLNEYNGLFSPLHFK